ncbi:hypothetical protein EDB80DRAFT_181211 [Ilyonectria destructans]|nr:hypothetical protein EDB80DRAFT_181211 [Ilyonectria destructans]
MLTLRSKVLKLSVSLNAIGSDAGRILDVNTAEELAEEQDHGPDRLVDHDGAQSGTSDEQMHGWSSEGSQEEGYMNHLCVTPNIPEPNTRGIEVLGIPEEPSRLLLDEINVSSGRSNIAGMNNDLDPADSATDRQHHHTHSPPAEEPAQNEQLSNTLRFLIDNSYDGRPVDIDPQNDSGFPELDVSYSSAGSWPMSTSTPVQDLMPYLMEVEAPERDLLGIEQQRIVDASQRDQEPLLVSLPIVPSQTGLSLPPGLFPVLNNKASQSPLLVQSRLSEHIEALEKHIRCKLDITPDKISRQRLHQCSVGIMSLFTQRAWPSTYPVWFKSQVPEIIGPILQWRLHPTTEAHNRLLPDYKPTELQLTVPHSAIIDWVPYAPLRDRVLLCYNGSVALDRLMCDMLNSYVIEVNDVSQIQSHAPPGRGYFGIWNLFSAINSAATNLPDCVDHTGNTDFVDPESITRGADTQQHYNSTTPSLERQESTLDGYSLASSMNNGRRRRLSSVPELSRSFNLADVLKTPASALRLSYDIRLYAAKSWKLDRSLFEAWPELKFEGYEKIIAKGKSFRIPTTPPDAPIPMTDITVKLYHSALETIT